MISSLSARLKQLSHKRRFLFRIVVVVILLTAFASTLHIHVSVSRKRARTKKFLEYVMVRDSGLYTLVGSKPMSSFPLWPLIDEAERPVSQSAIPLNAISKNSGKGFMLMNDEKRQNARELLAEINELTCPQYRFTTGWDGNYGIFINVPEVLFIFDKFSKDFSEITGMQKSPMEAAEEIGDETSEYWLKIKDSHYLQGLLLGFGEKNSKLFQWEADRQKKFSLRHGTVSSLGPRKTQGKYPLDKLSLPQFVVYQPIDPQLERYEEERNRCLNLYEGKDFIRQTLRILKGKPPK